MSNIYDIFYEPTQAFGYYNEWWYEQLHHSITDHYYDGNGAGEVGRVDVGGAADSNTDHYYDGIMSNIYDIFYEPTQAFGYYNEWSYEQLHQSIQVRLF